MVFVQQYPALLSLDFYLVLGLSHNIDATTLASYLHTSDLNTEEETKRIEFSLY